MKGAAGVTIRAFQDIHIYLQTSAEESEGDVGGSGLEIDSGPRVCLTISLFGPFPTSRTRHH